MNPRDKLDTETPHLEYDSSMPKVCHPEEDILNSYVYHGVSDGSKVLNILEVGSIKSPKRQKLNPSNSSAREEEIAFIEDVLRLFDGEPDERVHLVDFAEENRDIIRDYGSEEANSFVENHMDVFEYTGQHYLKEHGPYGPLRDFCVSVGDSITYHVGTRVSGDGAAFEFSVPTDTIINRGIEGNIPGEIPLDYATQIYYGKEMDPDTVSDIENHEGVQTYGIEIDPVTEFYRESDEFKL